MKKLFFLSLLMTALAWANTDDVSPSHTKMQMGTHSRCYDIDMAYFNQCQDIIIAHLSLDKTAKLIKADYDAKPSDTLTPDTIKAVVQKVERTDFTELFSPDNSKPIKVFILIDIMYQKQPISAEVAKELLLNCANDKRCNVNELENALQEKGL